MKQTNLTNAVSLITSAIKQTPGNNNLLIAVDGPCASGKTTLANILKEEVDCNVIPVDDFFLQPHQRTKERFEAVGENFDKERFLEEVILPLKSGKNFSYRPYDCKKEALSEAVGITRKPITVIEGVYSCHPDLNSFYDYRIFVKTDKATQLRRLKERNPLLLSRFVSEWIPLEEKYFSAFDIENKCDLVIEL
ncbi:MAG: deoxynucleoside kinase [Clostridia bacterium]|nr:deoxynucleoside kinase [Clostridia bacterium]